MVKHFKLFEMIGFMLLLFAWIADWHSVRHWNDVEDNYWKSIDGFYRVTEKTCDSLHQQFEIAVNRAIVGKEIDYSSPDAAYIAAWHSSEVRHLWLEGAANGFFRADNTSRTIIKISNENKLSVNIDIKKLNTFREEAKKQLTLLIDLSKGQALATQYSSEQMEEKIRLFDGAVKYPSEQEISVSDAKKIDENIKAFNASMFEPINEVGQAIKSSRNEISLIHKVIFGLGSLSIALAKFFEWLNILRKTSNKVDEPKT